MLDDPEPVDADEVLARHRGELERYLSTAVAYCRRQGMPEGVAVTIVVETYVRPPQRRD